LYAIIPFFKEYRLQTAKSNNFEIFARVVAMMSEGVHMEEEGFERIKELAAQTNWRKRRVAPVKCPLF
jgi:hypothetical protein